MEQKTKVLKGQEMTAPPSILCPDTHFLKGCFLSEVIRERNQTHLKLLTDTSSVVKGISGHSNVKKFTSIEKISL